MAVLVIIGSRTACCFMYMASYVFLLFSGTCQDRMVR